jgi:tetratricopeptide (TPR) repeat protein
MKRLSIFLLLTLLWLAANLVHAEDAGEYLELALKSSTASKKIKYLSKALELDPNLASAYAKRGMLYYFQERYDHVIEDFEKYTRLIPDDAEGYRMLGMGYLYNESYDSAIATFTHALTVDPSLISALCYRAEAYRRSGKNEEALRDSTEVIRLGKEARIVADAYITRAKVFGKIGQKKQAVADIRASLQIDPRTWFYRYVSGYASLEEIRGAGLIAILVLAFALIFKLRMKGPNQED